LKKSKKWNICGQNIEAIDTLNYLSIALENTGSWMKQNALLRAKGNYALIVIDKCLARIPSLEYIYEMLCESRIIYRVELWGPYEAWKISAKVHGRFCKKLLGLPRCAANGMAEMELGREQEGGR
jgi:hypothetical protein